MLALLVFVGHMFGPVHTPDVTEGVGLELWERETMFLLRSTEILLYRVAQKSHYS